MNKIEEFIRWNFFTIGMVIVVMALCFFFDAMRKMPEELKGGVLLRVNEIRHEVQKVRIEMDDMKERFQELTTHREFKPREVH